MAKLVIFGTGVMGDLIAEHFIHQSDWDVVAYTADADYVEGDTHNGFPLVPFEDIETRYPPGDTAMFVALSYGKANATRRSAFLRAKAAGYSISYFSLATVPLILAKNASKFKDWADLDKSGVTVAATLGTTQEKQVKQFFPNAEHKIVEAPARDFQEVLAGRADAHITSNVEAHKLVAKYPKMMIVPVMAPKAPTPIAMLLPQADQIWINYVNTWIALKTERGFFAGLGKKWQLSN